MLGKMKQSDTARSIHDEMKDIKRLIADRREVMNRIQDTINRQDKSKLNESDIARLDQRIHDEMITIKGLELYLNALENIPWRAKNNV